MYGGIIDATLNNVAITFDSSAGSLIIDSSSPGKNMSIINKTDHVLAFTFSGTEDVPESSLSLNRNQGFVPDRGYTTCDWILISNRVKIYIRSADGFPITSGEIYAWVWGL
jgi:hypothetical protein